jgi:adenylate cyclase
MAIRPDREGADNRTIVWGDRRSYSSSSTDRRPGVRVPEIERKFTVETVPQQLLGPGSPIRQGYLTVEPVEVRIRARDGTHELTAKSLGGLRRIEVNVPLTAGQFGELWSLVTASVEKTRHLVETGGVVVEVDVYAGKLEGLVVAEVEFPTEQEARDFDPPAWFGREVTEDRRFRNAALARANTRPD